MTSERARTTKKLGEGTMPISATGKVFAPGEIEAEEAALFQRLAERGSGKRVSSSGTGINLTPPRTANALKIRY